MITRICVSPVVGWLAGIGVPPSVGCALGDAAGSVVGFGGAAVGATVADGLIGAATVAVSVGGMAVGAAVGGGLVGATDGAQATTTTAATMISIT
jgi:hypothetical protein